MSLDSFWSLTLGVMQNVVQGNRTLAAAHPIIQEFSESILTPSRKPNPEYAYLEKLRQQWVTSTLSLPVKDLGAGPRKGKNQVRPLKSIAKHSLSPARFGRIMALLIQQIQPKHVLELGTSLGLTSLYLRHHLPRHGILTTFEGSPSLTSFSKRVFQQQSVDNIQVIAGNLDHTLPDFVQQAPPIDMVYFDANHRYEPTLRYWQTVKSVLQPDAILIFDDIHWSTEMRQAWKKISQHESSRICVDFFEAGVIWTTPTLPKQYHCLRWF